LRKAGGVEEAERMRKARDEQILKETWDAKKKSGITENTDDEAEKQEVLVTTEAAPTPVADGALAAEGPGSPALT